jgi:uncharacterized membrane protein YphA (DoxX/SURF4 family)
MKKSIINKEMMADMVSGLFILLFVYAASTKLLDYQKFQVQLGKSPVLAPFVSWVAWLIPAIEIGIALALLIRKIQLMALYASFCMMIIFSGYIILILNFSDYIPCSCGGILENMSWSQHLSFNFLFVLLACVGILLYPIGQRPIAIEGEAENPGQSRQKKFIKKP